MVEISRILLKRHHQGNPTCWQRSLYALVILVLFCGCSVSAKPEIEEEQMKFEVLEEEDFKKEYHKAFQKEILENEDEKERFRDEVFSVQGAVEESLQAKWNKVDDFEVGWNFDYCYHTCGGIYSDRIFCEDYVKTIGKALSSVDSKGRWTYHTVCEIIVNPDAKTAGESIEDRGEFFVRGDTCYINGSTMKPEWHTRMGCPD